MVLDPHVGTIDLDAEYVLMAGLGALICHLANVWLHKYSTEGKFIRIDGV